MLRSAEVDEIVLLLPCYWAIFWAIFVGYFLVGWFVIFGGFLFIGFFCFVFWGFKFFCAVLLVVLRVAVWAILVV